MSKDVKTMMGTSTETVYLSQWELTNDNKTKKEPAQVQTIPPECG